MSCPGGSTHIPRTSITSQFFLSYEVGDDDRFSPVVGGHVPLPCPVDLDSLFVLLGSDIRNANAGPQAEVWDWRSVLCGIARSSRLPELQDSDCPDRFREIGMTYVLDLSIRGTHSPVESPGGGLETVARSPPIPYCRVVECARSGCFPDRDDMRGNLGNHRDVCAEENSSVRARPEVCALDDGFSPNRDVVHGKLN